MEQLEAATDLVQAPVVVVAQILVVAVVAWLFQLTLAELAVVDMLL
jgi:hypothetical protein